MDRKSPPCRADQIDAPLVPSEAKTKKTPKVFSPSIRHFRTIPHPPSFSHNRPMPQNTAHEMERAQEIDDLLAWSETKTCN